MEFVMFPTNLSLLTLIPGAFVLETFAVLMYDIIPSNDAEVLHL